MSLPAPQSVTELPTFQWSSRSFSGTRKPTNDDSLTVFASGAKGAEILPARGSHSLQQHDLIFAVSDGMGGGKAGDIASALILEQMAQIIPETFKAAAAGIYPDSLTHLGEALQTIHHHLNACALEREDTKGMAATLAVAWFTPENLYLANAGDSRIYQSRGGILRQLTRDHTTAWGQWKRGEISEVQYRCHPRRSALYEVVGCGHQRLTPHFAAIPYLPGDRYLVCSDGLIDGLWERHISDALARCPDDPDTTVDTLLKRAIDNAGIDDTSLIVITVSPPHLE